MAVDVDALLFQFDMDVIVAGGALFPWGEPSRAHCKKKKNDRVEEKLQDALFPQDVFISLR